MNTPFRFFLILIILGISNCLFIPKANAQFTIKENFQGSSVGSTIILGGSPSAYLTSGVVDPVNEGWLRLTNANLNQKGYAYINSPFPSTLGALIDFEYKIWRDSILGNPGADGIGVYFFDATKTFSLGGYGGSLGYAPNTAATPPTSTGLAGGYIGIGLDEFGNFSNATEGRNGGSGLRCNSITLRGPTTNKANTTNPWIETIQLQTSNTSNSNSIDYNTITKSRPTDSVFYRRVKISIIPTGTGKYTISVTWRKTPTGIDSTLLTYQTTTAPPSSLKVGFAASTGGSSNYHEIRNVLITTPGGVRVDKTVDKSNAKVGDQLTYIINAYNSTTASLSNLILADTLKDVNGNMLNTGSGGVFTINSITFNNNGNAGNTAAGYTSGVPVTTGFTNPFSTKLKMDINSVSTFKVVGTINKLPSKGVIENSVGVDPTPTGITDTDLTNNYYSTYTNVLNADFVIDNSINNSCVDSINGNTYTLLVSNAGTEKSVEGKIVTVTDTIPSTFTVTDASGPGWNISHTGNNYAFTRSDGLDFSASYPPITITVKPPLLGISEVNKATVSYSGIEATSKNNCDSVILNATPEPPVVSSPLNYCIGSNAVALKATGSNLLWYKIIGGTGSSAAPTPATTTAGSTTFYVSQNNGICESPLSAIVVKINPATTLTIDTIVCHSYKAPDGQVYLSSGIKTAIIPNSAGCDSTITINLTVNVPTSSITDKTVCSYELPLTWNGLSIPAAGTYKDTLVNAAGCDSIATLNLTVHVPTGSMNNQTVCSYDLPYSWNGLSIPAAGTYKDTLVNAAGCDSICTLQLTVNPVPTVTNTSLTQTICSGTSTTLVNLTSDVASTTFEWTASTDTAITGFTINGTNTIPAQTLINPGNSTAGTVTYVITPKANGCTGPPVNYVVIVNPKPITSDIYHQ